MKPVKFLASIPQYAYEAEVVQKNEGIIAEQENLSLYQLMESAGLAAFQLLQTEWPNSKTILIVCGKGNNAGDGFILARLALAQGMNVYLHSLAAINEYQGDAQLACQKYLKAGGSLHKFNEIDLTRIDLIVDALLGTGLSGTVRENYRYVIELINQLEKPILSIDLPSGLDANTGQILGCAIKADITVTFVGVKKGLLTGVASDYCGELYFSGLGIGAAFTESISSNITVNSLGSLCSLPSRRQSSHKGNSGFALVIGGNLGMPGAARLSAEASLRSGAGLVGVICHKTNEAMMLSNRPELMLLKFDGEFIDNQQKIEKVNVVIAGPGLGTDAWAKNNFQQALALNKPMVVDADGLNLLAINPQYRDNWILTPHPGEAARLLNCSVAKIEQDRFESARAIALKYGGVCVLKGAGTLISDGENVAINISGNPGMAVGGMGDVLSGIIGALILQLNNIFLAAKYGVYLHGRAADLAIIDGQKGLLASDLFPYIRQLVNE
ncbi:NAD(P)H-hydrate dehydratase [Thalassotalea psychrophila]|uniref:Bifunctional NAD(P)H-hydrate repair enzyme n=1 Tax=Thalassotalea psychrophila TaxID=3065647 RepID=A0ABY9TUU7_9GAMM|nr:NAD(P)H-hydrate dehydratase [Colwelliaceae bacterium SQ149]